MLRRNLALSCKDDQNSELFSNISIQKTQLQFARVGMDFFVAVERLPVLICQLKP